MRGASRGVEQAEQDAAPARVVRDHASGRRKATDRANYVALPSVAARGAAERREIRRDELWLERPLDPAPGRAVPSPKVAVLERRKAMRCLGVAVASHMQGARQYNCAFRRSMPLVFRGRTKRSTRATRGSAFACVLESGCLKIEYERCSGARCLNALICHHRA